MSELRFKVGDRVQTTAPFMARQAGAPATIESVHDYSDRTWDYSIVFDGPADSIWLTSSGANDDELAPLTDAVDAEAVVNEIIAVFNDGSTTNAALVGRVLNILEKNYSERLD